MSHLRVFGCIAYALVKTYSRKFNEKYDKYIFVVTPIHAKHIKYKLYSPFSGKINISKDMVF